MDEVMTENFQAHSSCSEDEADNYMVIPATEKRRCKPMPEMHREAIRKMQRLFEQDLDVSHIMAHMIEGGILSDQKCDDIKARPTRAERVQTFLDILKRSGCDALSIFQDALKESYLHLYNELQSQLQLQIKEEKESQDYESLPSISKNIHYDDHNQECQRTSPDQSDDDVGETYKTALSPLSDYALSDYAYINGIARRASSGLFCHQTKASTMVCKETCTAEVIHIPHNFEEPSIRFSERPLPPIPNITDANSSSTESDTENENGSRDMAQHINSLSISTIDCTDDSKTVTVHIDDVLFLDESEGERQETLEDGGGLEFIRVWDKYGHLLRVRSSKLKMFGDPFGEPWYFPVPVFSDHIDLILGTYKKPGVFLVYKPLHANNGTTKRKVENIMFNLALVMHQGSKYITVHYPIKGLPGGPVIMQDLIKFSCIQDLITFYKGNRASLPCRLRHPPISADKPILPGIRYDVKWHIAEAALEYLETGASSSIWQGQLGRVVYAYKENIPVAVKFQTAKQQIDQWSTEMFFEEALILTKMDHKNIVQLYGFSMVKTPFIVLEYFPRTLLEALKADDVKKSYRNVCQMLNHVLMALKHLESLAYVIHCNVQAKSILIGKDQYLKLADFGLARMVVADGFYAEENAQIPSRCSAPEVLTEGLFSTKSDIWSFGVLFWEILSDGFSRPYGESRVRQICKFLESGTRLQCPVGHAKDIQTLFQSITDVCWNLHWKNRPTAAHLLEVINTDDMNRTPSFHIHETSTPKVRAIGPDIRQSHLNVRSKTGFFGKILNKQRWSRIK